MSLRDIDPTPDLDHDIASNDPIWWDVAEGSNPMVWLGKCRYCTRWAIDFPPSTHDAWCPWMMRRNELGCHHGIVFDQSYADNLELSSQEVRTKFPRLHADCPLGCGFTGIAYASGIHLTYGDW